MMNLVVGAIDLVVRFYLMVRVNYDRGPSTFGSASAVELLRCYYDGHLYSYTCLLPPRSWALDIDLSELVSSSSSRRGLRSQVKSLLLYFAEMKDLDFQLGYCVYLVWLPWLMWRGQWILDYRICWLWA